MYRSWTLSSFAPLWGQSEHCRGWVAIAATVDGQRRRYCTTEGALHLDGVDRLEAHLGFRMANTGLPKRHFATRISGARTSFLGRASRIVFIEALLGETMNPGQALEFWGRCERTTAC
jgi:hypothetical protein